jgi:hypothetical protein
VEQENEQQQQQQKKLRGGEEKGKKINISTAKNHAQLSLLELLQATEDTANNIIISLLQGRSSAAASLSLSSLTQLSQLMTTFSTFSTKTCGRKPQLVIKKFTELSKVFLESYSSRELKKTIMFLDNDNWSVTAVSAEFQRIVDGIITGSIEEEITEKGKENDLSSSSYQNNQKTQKALQIGSKRYHVIGSLLLLLTCLRSLMVLPRHVPCLGNEIAFKISQMIQTFNRRANQLILNAELTKTQKTVKVISGKLLSVTSQTLSALIDLLPFITSFVITNLPHEALSQQKRHLDSALDSLQNHNQMIFAKFVAILKDRLHVRYFHDLKTVLEWYCPQDQSAALPPPSKATEMFLLEVKKTHKILATYLFPDQLRAVFHSVFQMITTELAEIFNKYDFHSTITGQKRLYYDLSFLLSSLGEMEGIDPPPQTLLNDICKRFPLVGITTQLAEKKKENKS